MKNIIEELANLFNASPLPLPDFIQRVDKEFAKQWGIDLDKVDSRKD